MKAVILDIETLRQPPYPYLVKGPETFRPPRTHKRPLSIAKWQEEQAAEQVAKLTETTSLEPMRGGIVACVGVWRTPAERPEPLVLENKTSNEEGERKMLSSLETMLSVALGGQGVIVPLVTWNGSALDYPFLAARALRHGLLKLAGFLYQEKPWDKKLLDLRLVWTRGDKRGVGTMDDVARFLGFPDSVSPLTGETDTLHGKFTTEAWFSGDEGRRRVLDHCRADVRRLEHVFRILVAAGWVGGPGYGDPIPPVPPRDLEADRKELEVKVRSAHRGLSPEQLAEAIQTAEATLAGEVVSTVRDLFERPWTGRADVAKLGKTFTPGHLLDLDRDYLAELRTLLVARDEEVADG